MLCGLSGPDFIFEIRSAQFGIVGTAVQPVAAQSADMVANKAPVICVYVNSETVSHINDHGLPVVCRVAGSLASLGGPRAVPNSRGSPFGTQHSIHAW